MTSKGKTLSGIPILDQRFGGLYRGRACLCIGASGSGKSVALMQFLRQSLLNQERVLIVTYSTTEELIDEAEKFDIDLITALDELRLFVLEYKLLFSSEEENPDFLSDETFLMLQRYIETKRIERMAIDPVLPWVTVPQGQQLEQHLRNFIHDLEALGPTTLITLPEAVSSLAKRLTTSLQTLVPIAFRLEHGERGRYLVFTRFLGETHLPPPVPILIEPPEGITQGTKSVPLHVTSRLNGGKEIL